MKEGKKKEELAVRYENEKVGSIQRKKETNFLRALILGGQFWKCTNCEGGRNIKTQEWPFMETLSNYITIEANPR